MLVEVGKWHRLPVVGIEGGAGDRESQNPKKEKDRESWNVLRKDVDFLRVNIDGKEVGIVVTSMGVVQLLEGDNLRR